LQPAKAYEFDVSAIAFNYFFGDFNPTCARGEAALAAGRPAEATTEFNKIINHPGLLMVDPLAAIVHLHLARVYTKMGDLPNAKSAYADFFPSGKMLIAIYHWCGRPGPNWRNCSDCA